MASDRLRLGSAMAPNMDYLMEAVAERLSAALPWQVSFVRGSGWQAQEQMFDEGGIDAIWICGLPYVWKADDPARAVELLAAPVMAGERYGGRPVYYSDVVVAAGSTSRSFEDLRGVRWSFNEPGSHSGYNIVRAQLANRGQDWSFFSEVIQSGSHERSLKMIVQGEIEASAIDTTVMEEAMRRDPALSARLRVVTTFGPSPIPPLIVQRSLPSEVRDRLREALITWGTDSSEARERLQSMGLRGFTTVTDADYDPIREIDRQAAAVPPLLGGDKET